MALVMVFKLSKVLIIPVGFPIGTTVPLAFTAAEKLYPAVTCTTLLRPAGTLHCPAAL